MGAAIKEKDIQLSKDAFKAKIKEFEKIKKGSIVTISTIKRRRLRELKEGLCIYKDKKIFTIQFDNYKESYTIDQFKKLDIVKIK